MRELNRMVTALEDESAQKFVLCTGTKMRAVLVSLDEYLGRIGSD